MQKEKDADSESGQEAQKEALAKLERYSADDFKCLASIPLYKNKNQESMEMVKKDPVMFLQKYCFATNGS